MKNETIERIAVRAEVWRPVPSLPHIHASSKGRLRYMGEPRRSSTFRPGKILKQFNGKLGYQTSCIPQEASGPANSKMMSVHRLVCEAFHGPEPEASERIVVGHLNSDPTDNRPENLKWMTQRENISDPVCRAKMTAVRTGKVQPPHVREKIARSNKLTRERKAAEARKAYAVADLFTGLE